DRQRRVERRVDLPPPRGPRARAVAAARVVGADPGVARRAAADRLCQAYARASGGLGLRVVSTDTAFTTKARRHEGTKARRHEGTKAAPEGTATSWGA